MLQKTIMKSQFCKNLFSKKYGHLLKSPVSAGARSAFRRARRSPYKDNEWHCNLSPWSVWEKMIAFPRFYRSWCFGLRRPARLRRLFSLATPGKGDLRHARCPIDFVLIVFGSSVMKSTTPGNKEISLLFTQNIECVLSKLLN